jgi:formylglycine-generating enzyme required for sulfatase activity
VDTDVAVPDLLDRVRVDVFSKDGNTWLDTRDISVRVDPESKESTNTGAFALPFSFALESASSVRDALLRIRGYREGKVRDYRGERFSLATSEPDSDATPICQRAQLLALNSSTVLDAALESESAPLSCNGITAKTGVAAASVRVETQGTFSFTLDQVVPNGGFGSYAKPILFVTEDCTQLSPIVGCAGSASDQEGTQGLHVTGPLRVGNYAVLLANSQPANIEARLTFESAESSGAEVDYSTDAVKPESPVDEQPRLVVDGVDLTPAVEPEPSVTVDRLVWVRLGARADQSLRVQLNGDCFGIMADLYGARTCLDSRAVYEVLQPAQLSPAKEQDKASMSATWQPVSHKGCSDQSGNGLDRVCVPGGIFTLGDARIVASGLDSATPEHVVVIEPFLIDRYEFTVARYRALRKANTDIHGEPMNNTGPIDFATGGVDGNYCTYNADVLGGALYPERDTFPLTCVTWATARSICQALGGDLPTSAQWEYAAAATGKGGSESEYPWGDSAPDCGDAVFARWAEQGHGHNDCFSTTSFGPVAIDSKPAADRDQTPLGIVGMGGNASEWTLDAHRAYSDHCWTWESLINPHCGDSVAPLRTAKGGSWRQGAAFTRAAIRIGAPPSAVDDGIGFRCVYPNVEP